MIPFIFWFSVLGSPLLAAIGVWRSSWEILLLSGVVSLPFALYLAANPGGRLFSIVPLLHFAAAALLQRAWRVRIGWVLLAAIVSFSLWFLWIAWGAVLA